MKILITGGSGFLGYHLSARLRAQGEEVTALSSKECDLTHSDALKPWNTQRFDYIYHLAAWTQAGDFCLYHPGEQWIHNQLINAHVLSWWLHHQPQATLVCMGTSCAYDPSLSLREENYLDGKPIDSLFSYAMTKRMLLAGCEALHRQYGLNYLYLIPSTLYGTHYHTDARQLHFIFDLIRKILKGFFLGETVTLWGDGTQKRELIHIEDFISILLMLVQTTRNEWINVGSGEEYSIRSFAHLICNHVGYPFEKILFDSTRYVGARSKVLWIEHLRSKLPLLQLRPLEEGLAETIDWFQTQFFPDKHMLTPSAPKCRYAISPG